ncbi:MAG: GntR family transcriptional regulator [Magnetovibrionaceae bacterium]
MTEFTTTETQPTPSGGTEEAATLTDRAYGEIEELIVTLRLEPGAVLSEATLSRQLGIGRTPIREALQRLAREGLVVIMPRRGIMVSEINVGTQLKLIEVRREVERLMAKLAAERAIGPMRDQMADLADAFEAAAEDGSSTAFLRHEKHLSALITDAAGNEFAAKTMALMRGLSRRFWYRHFGRVASLETSSAHYAALARAIASGDGRQAALDADALMDYVDSCTRAALDG